MSEAEHVQIPTFADEETDTDGPGAGPAQKTWPAFIPADYIEEPRLRIQAYRQIAEVTKTDEVDDLRAIWRDRFGMVPPAAENLLAYAHLKLLAATRRVQQVEVRREKVMLTRGGDFVIVGGKFPRLTSRDGASKMRELSDLLQHL